jgi:hypothetical protein
VKTPVRLGWRRGDDGSLGVVVQDDSGDARVGEIFESGADLGRVHDLVGPSVTRADQRLTRVRFIIARLIESARLRP